MSNSPHLAVARNTPASGAAPPARAVPPLDDAWLDAEGIVGHNGRDARSRPFNLLRTRVVRAVRENGWKLIGVTSAAPGAGKSFVTLNLGAAIAQMQDVQVAVVDFDLRRPSLIHKLGIEAEQGVDDVLEGEAARLADIGLAIDPLNITLFPAHRARGATSELLTGESFAGAIAALRTLPENAIVLCDLPPAFANDDAMMILQHLDAYLFVIDEGATTQTQLRDAMGLLAAFPCLGTVLNRFTSTGDGAYGMGGRYDQYYQD